jgi:HK97 gp10 family phage protein
MADLDFEFRGFDALAKRMSAIAQEVAPRSRRMVRAGAQVFKDEMVQRAPLLAKKNTGSDSLEPGALKDGIRILVPKSVEPVEAHIGPRGRELIRVATDVEFGHRQIHGGSLTLLGNGKSKGTGTAGEDVSAHPFVRPTFESAQGAAEAAMVEEFDKPFEETN